MQIPTADTSILPGIHDQFIIPRLNKYSSGYILLYIDKKKTHTLKMKMLSKGWRIHYQMNKIWKRKFKGWLPWTNQLSHVQALETVVRNKGMGKNTGNY